MHTYGDRARLDNLFKAEINRFIETHPQSGKNHQKALGPMVQGVPMIWMSKWPGPFPIYVDHAKGSHFTDVDGLDYTDFCLGDTGAMCGHAPDATVKAVQNQISKGSTYMLPTEDAIVSANLLAERFGLPKWQQLLQPLCGFQG